MGKSLKKLARFVQPVVTVRLIAVAILAQSILTSSPAQLALISLEQEQNQPMIALLAKLVIIASSKVRLRRQLSYSNATTETTSLDTRSLTLTSALRDSTVRQALQSLNPVTMVSGRPAREPPRKTSAFPAHEANGASLHPCSRMLASSLG